MEKYEPNPILFISLFINLFCISLMVLENHYYLIVVMKVLGVLMQDLVKVVLISLMVIVIMVNGLMMHKVCLTYYY